MDDFYIYEDENGNKMTYGDAVITLKNVKFGVPRENVLLALHVIHEIGFDQFNKSRINKLDMWEVCDFLLNELENEKKNKPKIKETDDHKKPNENTHKKDVIKNPRLF